MEYHIGDIQIRCQELVWSSEDFSANCAYAIQTWQLDCKEDIKTNIISYPLMNQTIVLGIKIMWIVEVSS